MIGLTTMLGWRMALVASGIIGLLATLLLLAQWGQMREEIEEAKPAKKADAKAIPADAGAGLKLLRQAERMAKECGAECFMLSAPIGSKLERVLHSTKYRPTNVSFFRSLA